MRSRSASSIGLGRRREPDCSFTLPFAEPRSGSRVGVVFMAHETAVWRSGGGGAQGLSTVAEGREEKVWSATVERPVDEWSNDGRPSARAKWTAGVTAGVYGQGARRRQRRRRRLRRRRQQQRRGSVRGRGKGSGPDLGRGGRVQRRPTEREGKVSGRCYGGSIRSVDVRQANGGARWRTFVYGGGERSGWG